MVSLSLQCTPHVLKIYLFELPDNKNTGTFFSKYELLFPNQANSSSDPFQILILQHHPYIFPASLNISGWFCPAQFFDFSFFEYQGQMATEALGQSVQTKIFINPF